MAQIDLNTLMQANQLLFDKSQPFNENKAQALDLVTMGTCSKSIQIIQLSNKIWNELQNDAEFWTCADQVLQLCSSNQTKFLSLKILEEQIKNKWGLIAPESREVLKAFMVKQMLTLGAKGASNQIEESLLSQINISIIQILKHEWRTSWTNFIPEICEASQSNQNLCENNLKVLKLLSEEIFDYSKNQMTSQQITELKNALHKEFGQIFQLCFFIMKTYLENSKQIKLSLIKQTMETLLTYLSWIPFGFIFMTELIEALIQLFDDQNLRNCAIRCLYEIVTLKIETEQQNLVAQQQKLAFIFEKFLLKLKQIFPCDFGLVNERQRLRGVSNTQLQLFDDFCCVLTLFFTGLFNTHLSWLEIQAKNNMMVTQLIELGLQYIICFSALPLEQNYKVVTEFWFDFTKRLLEQPATPQNTQIVLNIYGGDQQITLSNSVYPKILLELRKIVVSKMSKPQEVLISIDECGMPFKEELTNTENNAMYELLKDLLINLAKLNWNYTRDIISQKLDKQVIDQQQLINALKMAYYQ